MKIKVLTYYANEHDATSFHRGHGVMSELYRHNYSYVNGEYDYDIQKESKLSWIRAKGYDLVFFQRPFYDAHVELLEHAKILNKKIWIDYDDIMFNLPSHSAVLKHLPRSKIEKNVKICCQIADKITVSTEQLKIHMINYLGKDYENKFVVIPNALDDYMFQENKYVEQRCPIIVWRGSDTHKHDLMRYEDDICKIIKEYEKYFFIFVGYNPTFITSNFPKRTKFQPSLDISGYYHYIKMIKPKMFLVPLEDTIFNHCKSDIVSMEAAYSGAPCITPNFGQFQESKNFMYDPKKENSFYNCFCNVIEKDDILKEKVIENQKYFQTRRLSCINQQRIKVIDELLDIRK
jgi:hypothetical protein